MSSRTEGEKYMCVLLDAVVIPEPEHKSLQGAVFITDGYGSMRYSPG